MAIPRDVTDLFSHAGMIVTSEILDHPLVVPGHIYIWESTLGGVYGITDGVKNVEGKVFFGAQLRDFDDVVRGYDRNPRTRIAICHVRADQTPLFDEDTKRRFTEVFNEHNGTGYD